MYFDFLNGPILTSFYVYFHPFLIPTTNKDAISAVSIEKSRDAVLGIQTQGRRLVGADET